MICKKHNEVITYFLISPSLKMATQSTFKCQKCLNTDFILPQDKIVPICNAIAVLNNEKEFQQERIQQYWDKTTQLHHNIVSKFNKSINDVLQEVTKRLIIIKQTNFKLVQEWIDTNKKQIDNYFFNKDPAKTMVELSEMILQSNDDLKIYQYYNQYIKQVQKIDHIQNLRYSQESIDFLDNYIRHLKSEFVEKFDNIFKLNVAQFFRNKSNINIKQEMDKISDTFIQQEANYYEHMFSIIKKLKFNQQDNNKLKLPHSPPLPPLSSNQSSQLQQQNSLLLESPKPLNSNSTDIQLNQPKPISKTQERQQSPIDTPLHLTSSFCNNSFEPVKYHDFTKVFLNLQHSFNDILENGQQQLQLISQLDQPSNPLLGEQLVQLDQQSNLVLGGQQLQLDQPSNPMLGEQLVNSDQSHYELGEQLQLNYSSNPLLGEQLVITDQQSNLALGEQQLELICQLDQQPNLMLEKQQQQQQQQQLNQILPDQQLVSNISAFHQTLLKQAEQQRQEEQLQQKKYLPQKEIKPIITEKIDNSNKLFPVQSSNHNLQDQKLSFQKQQKTPSSEFKSQVKDSLTKQLIIQSEQAQSINLENQEILSTNQQQQLLTNQLQSSTSQLQLSTLQQQQQPTSYLQLSPYQLQLPNNQQQLSINQQQQPTHQLQLSTHQQQLSSYQQLSTNQLQLPNNQQQLPTSQLQLSTHQLQLPNNQQQLPTYQQLSTNQLQLPTNYQQLSTSQQQLSQYQLQLAIVQQQLSVHQQYQTNQQQQQQQSSSHQLQLPTNYQQFQAYQQQLPISQQQIPTSQSYVSPHQQQLLTNQLQLPSHQQQLATNQLQGQNQQLQQSNIIFQNQIEAMIKDNQQIADLRTNKPTEIDILLQQQIAEYIEQEKQDQDFGDTQPQLNIQDSDINLNQNKILNNQPQIDIEDESIQEEDLFEPSSINEKQIEQKMQMGKQITPIQVSLPHQQSKDSIIHYANIQTKAEQHNAEKMVEEKVQPALPPKLLTNCNEIIEIQDNDDNDESINEQEIIEEKNYSQLLQNVEQLNEIKPQMLQNQYNSSKDIRKHIENSQKVNNVAETENQQPKHLFELKKLNITKRILTMNNDEFSKIKQQKPTVKLNIVRVESVTKNSSRLQNNDTNLNLSFFEGDSVIEKDEFKNIFNKKYIEKERKNYY